MRQIVEAVDTVQVHELGNVDEKDAAKISNKFYLVFFSSDQRSIRILTLTSTRI